LSTKLLIGSANAHKVAEIKAMLSHLPVTITDLNAFPGIAAPAEDGDSFLANAVLKARYYHRVAHLPCMADDSGLAVAALNGAPGIYSARFAGAQGDDSANNALLLEQLKGQSNRNAYFVSVVAYFDGQMLRVFRGELHGHIAEKSKGSNGFGYDPLFIPSGSDRTLAEYTAEEKNSISHRARSMRYFTRWYGAISHN
jgi:XTP/dITP diphosphohydrolase